MAAVMFSLFVLVSTLFHHRAEAKLSLVDINRVLMTYNAAYDTCKEINDFSGFASQAAADEACDWAFKALDSIWLNTCSGWRNAACRLVDGEPHRQCTCSISHCDNYSIKNNEVMSFRDCASYLWTQELATDQVPVPTVTFRKRRGDYDTVLQAALSRRANGHSGLHGRASSSSGDYNSGAGSSNGIHTTGVVGSSSIIHTSDYGDLSAAVYGTPSAAGYGDPSAAFYGDTSTTVYGDQSAAVFGDASIAAYGNSIAVYPSYAAGAASETIPAPVLWCDHCDSYFSSELALFVHKRTERPVPGLHCYICNSTYKYKKAYRNHLLEKHPTVAAAEKVEPDVVSTFKELEKKPFACGECARSFPSTRALRDHEKTHTSVDTYCFLCDVSLASKQSYKHHMKKRHPEWAAAELEAAKLQHAKENPEQCDQCPKRYKNARGLAEHKKFHDGETKCHDCGETFSRVAYLNTHKRKEHPK